MTQSGVLNYKVHVLPADQSRHIDQQPLTCGVYSQQYTEYRSGYSKDHPVIVNFWEVFDEFTEEHKKKFLSEFMEG